MPLARRKIEASSINSIEQLVSVLQEKERELIERRQHLEDEKSTLKNDKSSDEWDAPHYRDNTQANCQSLANVERQISAVRSTLNEISSGLYRGECIKCDGELSFDIVASLFVTKCVHCRQKEEDKRLH